MCTGQKRKFALPQDRQYYANKNVQNWNDALANKRAADASSNGEDGHGAGDEREPSDGFDFNLDKMD
jgi:hypothetical protein